MALQPPLTGASVRRRGKIVQKGPDGIVYGEGFMGRVVPTGRLVDQTKKPVATRTLGGRRRAG